MRRAAGSSPKLAEEPGQLFFRVGVDDHRGRELAPRIHPHIERAVAHDAETALRIFQLARGDAEIEQRSADSHDSELVEDFAGVAEVDLPQGHAAAIGREPFAGVLDRVGILIERQNIGAGAQNLLGMAAAAAGGIDDQCAGARREQLDGFRHEHRTMISKILHFLRLLLDLQRTGREPDGPLKQQRVHDFLATIPTVRSHSRRVGRSASLPLERASIFADSKFQNGRARRRARPRLSSPAPCKGLPAEPDGPGDRTRRVSARECN